MSKQPIDEAYRDHQIHAHIGGYTVRKDDVVLHEVSSDCKTDTNTFLQRAKVWVDNKVSHV